MTSAFSSTARAPPSTARCASSSETEALTSTTGTRGPFAREAQEVEARAAGHPVVGHDEIDGRALEEGRRRGNAHDRKERLQLNDFRHLSAVRDGAQIDRMIERAAYEIRRVIAGQDLLLERTFVALLAGGHLLLEGVPGLAKTLTIRTVA